MRSAALVIVIAAGLAAGCRDHRPAPSQPLPAAAQQPVNPDAGVTRYVCTDGQAITAGYPDRETAVVTYKDHAYTLKLARSADGARYTGYGLQWWVKGDHAAMAALGPGEDVARAAAVDCVAQESPTVIRAI